MTKQARIFSIPATVPFLERFAQALLAGEIIENFLVADNPLSLARATIYLPTRRAVRALSDIFREKNIVPHPQLRALGEFEDDENLFVEDIDATGLPPAIAPLERQVILTRLILHWLKVQQGDDKLAFTPSSPADAAHLARELMRLIDMLTHEGRDISTLQAELPLDLQQHWERAYEFLKVASVFWPDYLKIAKQMEPAARRSLLMQREAERLLVAPDHPVIVAGSTGSVPVTAEFIAAIAKHPRGAVVLPGLDRDLDEKSWEIVGRGQEPGHPQASLAALLQKFKIARGDVFFLEDETELRTREHLTSEIMRPAATSEAWGETVFPEKDLRDAIESISLVEAAHEHEEALSIACLLRETLEHDGATAALVTPDRQLARLVASELKRFGLQVDDSAGTPLNFTQTGIFARLVADTALNIYDNAAVLSLLRHPLCTLGQDAEDIEDANGAIERVLFRGFASEKNIEAMLRKFDTPPETESTKTLSASQRTLGKKRMKRLHETLRNFAAVLQNSENSFGIFLQMHLEALLACVATHENDGEDILQSSEEGYVLIEFFEALQKAGPEHIIIGGVDYPLLLNGFAAQIPVRAVQSEPRLHIYGLLEARLITHDRLILGGLSEGVWPASSQTDLWLSRGMRANLSLPLPERRIGLSAHDFAQGLGTRDVWLTRARKTGGDPSVPSRFVQRLAAVAGEPYFKEICARGKTALAMVRQLNEAPPAQSISRPAPKPPQAARPRRLSVTDIEALLRDPYAIYARHVLRLKPFEQLDAAFDHRQCGLIIHAILNDFARAVNDGEHPIPEVLERIARKYFESYFMDMEVKAYWWPRFRALMPELAAFERERRETCAAVATEVPGLMKLKLPAGEFQISARADRIEKKSDAFALVDYKTGSLPALKKINQSYALQLTLQAAMLERGAFGEFKGNSDELIYVGFNDPDELALRAVPAKDIMMFAEQTLASVQRVIEKFDAGAAYVSRADSNIAASYEDYHHLARLREWGLAGEEADALNQPLAKIQNPLIIDEITLERQRRASNPASSAWVSANAGSGKTFVLAQRVKRLLLSGVAPEKILCLTYTKTAAANMANRILSDLATWVRMPQAKLREALGSLDGRMSQQISEHELRRARRLFALALETPGGLKIQTIHAFCDALLHQFPFEVGIAGQFSILDDRQRQAMIEEAFTAVLQSEDENLQRLLLARTPQTLKETIDKNYTRFATLFRQEENMQAALFAALEIESGLTEDLLFAKIIEESVLPKSAWSQVITALEEIGGARDREIARHLGAALHSDVPAKYYLKIFVTGDNNFRAASKFLSVGFKKIYPQFRTLLESEFERLAPLHQQLRLIEIAQNTLALLHVVRAVWRHVEAKKAAASLLDFSDMIECTDALLNSEAAAWVRYKLDSGVDHILVDEAQDTSAAQWRVIFGLAQEFFAGKGAREIPRTIFAVGDDKQSIFSFQGARREVFNERKNFVAKASKESGLDFADVSLNLSFRSSSIILNAVDGIFANENAARDVTGAEFFPAHEAAKRSLPGLVELWPPEMPSARTEVEAFDHPFISQPHGNPRTRLAAKIANEVNRAMNSGAIDAGDVLILVRTRNALFESLIRELKQSGLPVAGADRLILNEHIAVMDLSALAQAMLLPEDDLNFAALLKSPLFGLDDEDLFELAHKRTGSLHESLENLKGQKPLWDKVYLQFIAWDGRALNCRPYEFFATVLGADGGRNAFCSRLGAEAGEVLDEFLNLALAFEKTATPTLQNFLKFLRETKTEIKREMQQGQNEVRVMTVHNAKGLEAKWIILADTTDKPGTKHLGDFYDFDGNALIWAPGEKNRIGAIARAKDNAQALLEGEYRRLLYVALTRAEERLTICAACTKDKIPEGCWYDFAYATLQPLSSEEKDSAGNVSRWVMKTGEPLAQKSPLPQNNEAKLSAPAWLKQIPKSVMPLDILRPSDVDEFERNGKGAAPEEARLRGILLHSLLEHLPCLDEDKRASAAYSFLKNQAPHFSESEMQALIEEALGVFALPEARKFFSGNSLSEVPLNAKIRINGKETIVQGQVDRLLLMPDTLHIVDYKSGMPGEFPQNYTAQLSLYREALRPLAGVRAIKCYLLWTSLPRLDEIGAPTLEAALAKIA